MINRIRPVSANFINDIFSLHEQRVNRVKPRKINEKKLKKIKDAIDKASKDVESPNNISIFEEFSPFTAHILRNKALQEICREVFGVKINDNNLTRYHYFLSDESKTLLYINLKPMSNIEEGITIIDEMGKSIHVDESGQTEGTYCSKINLDGKKIEIEFNYYIGFIKED